jgi:hypothetical protein
MSCTATAELPESKLEVSRAVVRIGTEKSSLVSEATAEQKLVASSESAAVAFDTTT